MPKFPAFTVTGNGILRVLITPIKLSKPLTGTVKRDDKRILDSKALWDTGASGSCITKELADQLGLQPIAKMDVHHADGTSVKNVYMINIYMEPNMMIPNVRVTEFVSNGQFDMLIGMDVISMGDFAITNKQGITKFSFRVPSIADIDFVKEGKEAVTPDNVSEKPGRNDKCHCGSGKKYKHCHGKNY